jgi:hypothetical protein
MRSLLPSEVVMTPVPDHEPDIAVNGLSDACTEPGNAATPSKAAAATAVSVDFARWFNTLVIENMTASPLFWLS